MLVVNGESIGGRSFKILPLIYTPASPLHVFNMFMLKGDSGKTSPRRNACSTGIVKDCQIRQLRADYQRALVLLKCSKATLPAYDIHIASSECSKILDSVLECSFINEMFIRRAIVALC